MHYSVVLLGKGGSGTVAAAASGLAKHLTLLDVVTRAGLDVTVLLLLVGWLYRRHRAVPEMPLVLTALNLGLFAAMTAITAGKFPAGVGFGLFGILSLVRLRSASFTLRDVAYTFLSLVMALAAGLPARGSYLAAAIDAALVLAVLVVDDPRSHPATSTVRVTLDRLYPDADALRTDLAARLAVEPLQVSVDEVDYVRETTRVTVSHVLPDSTAPAPVEAADSRPLQEITA